MTIEDLLAKQEIYELSCSYMRGLDRLDGDLQKTVFHREATVDYGFFQGSGSEFVEFAQRVLKSHAANHHMLGQVDIKVDGERATGEVYFQAYHRVVENDVPIDLFIAGRYLDRYAKDQGVWKILFRQEINDWASRHPASEGTSLSAPALRGARRPEDASYGMQSSLSVRD
ncbi:MAG: nuclear transport factor 2 family protein [Proteobacteria bacterium]|nr:nuclear transport factor 2 family protein [Pseudomonadota bacterium]